MCKDNTFILIGQGKTGTYNRKNQKFVFSLTKSYLCPLIDWVNHTKLTTYMKRRAFCVNLVLTFCSRTENVVTLPANDYNNQNLLMLMV